MRIVHTSDWHLGRTFGGQSLHAHQEQFIEWLVAFVRSERAEVVLVAGDVYDRSVPAAETVALFGWALRSLRGAGAQVVAIAGNHDSAERLGAYDDLTDLAGVYIRGGYRRAGEVLRLEAGDGALDVAVVPFLEPALAPVDPDETPRPRPTHREVMEGPLDRARTAVRGLRSIVVAHAFVAGASSSESERTLSVGGGGLVPASLFRGFSYAALGHLHKPQALDDAVRYSGSPLPYSFSEQHAKQVLIVDLDSDGSVSARPVIVDVGRRVATVRGTLAEILADPRHDSLGQCWVRAVLTDTTYVLDAKTTLQRRFPHVVEVVLDPVRRANGDGPGGAATAGSGRTPLQQASAYWEATTGEAPTPAIGELLLAALEDVVGSGEVAMPTIDGGHGDLRLFDDDAIGNAS